MLQSSLDLFRSSILSTSVSSKFYKFMLQINKKFIPRTLVNRAQDCCEKHNVNFVKYLFYDDYRVKCKKHVNSSIPLGIDGLVDSVRHLISGNYTYDHKCILNSLLKSF